jgi:prepilin-type N-terminal cleavage/methylation domain-containing protein
MTPTAAHRDPSRPAAAFGRAFTLMELMVSIAILVIIILSVGVTFSGASRSVSNSQALMDTLANIRAIQGQLERDIASIDKNTFLVLRSRVMDTDPGHKNFSRRFDQIAFISNGSFPNRTGANDAPGPLYAPFTDGSTANAALVWWGQPVLERNSASPPPSFVASNQTAKTPRDALPTGAIKDGTGAVVLTQETDFALGRRAMRLFPGPATAANGYTIYPAARPVAAYPTAAWSCVPQITANGEGVAADITSSRIANVAQTSAQVMAEIAALRAGGTDTWPEAHEYCFRPRVLASVYETEVAQNPFVNGYFRLSPMAMQGVSSFVVEWSDGTIDVSNNQLRWYSYFDQKGDPGIESVNAAGDALTGDQYIATFSYYNRAYWPKALRFKFHVVDPNNRLQGGRDFVHVVKLPD